MSNTINLRSLPSVQHDLPYSLSSLYSGHARGRYPWLGRLDPDGRQSSMLWVNVQSYNDWAAARGLKSTIAVTGGQR
jgi:hypothetical protein